MSYVGTEVVTTVNDTQSIAQKGFSVYTEEQVLNIQASEAGEATIYNIEGRKITTISYSKGITKVTGLQPGIYMINGVKVLMY